jgi:hypothetical protein
MEGLQEAAIASQTLASWVQAIGSLVGLGIAIAVPAGLFWMQHRKERANAVRVARSEALHILPKIDIYQQTLRKELTPRSDRGPRVAFASVLDAIRITDLKDDVREFHRLDTLAPQTQELYFWARDTWINGMNFWHECGDWDELNFQNDIRFRSFMDQAKTVLELAESTRADYFNYLAGDLSERLMTLVRTRRTRQIRN